MGTTWRIHYVVHNIAIQGAKDNFCGFVRFLLPSTVTLRATIYPKVHIFMSIFTWLPHTKKYSFKYEN